MKLSAEDFLTTSLRRCSWGKEVTKILAASLAAVDPESLISNKIKLTGNSLQIANKIINLEEVQHTVVVSIGKAAIPMALAAEKILHKHLHKTIILTKYGYVIESDTISDRLMLLYGSHPVPDQRSIQSTSKIITELHNLKAKDLVILLLSGGGSALFAKPAAGISLQDLQQTNQVLLSSGVSIQEHNTIRKHISEVKGGQLAKLIYPARLFTLALSDVPNGRIDMIASGVSVPDPTTFNQALEIINGHDIRADLPRSVMNYLELGRLGKKPETPKPGDQIFERTHHLILAGNDTALKGAVDQAKKQKMQTEIWPAPLAGEAKLVGVSEVTKMLTRIKGISAQDKCSLIITGGETIVKLPQLPIPGQGGRNLEVALGSLELLKGIDDICLITMATDGEDGPTDAAGAVVTGRSYQRAIEAGLDFVDFLARHDSYHFFKELGDLIIIGPTQTNVNDLLFLFKW
jgi:hydroxypyruvate reductase